jgi:hypothetical protein
MREALTILGFGPCHHMREVIANDDQKRLWRAVARGASPDWNQLFSGYASCVDWPSAHYWRELVTNYPVARVILTYRSPESWWESFEKTILPGLQQSVDQDSLGIALVAKQVFGGKPENRAYAIACYEANVRAVHEIVPRARLLVHTLGDDWEPLCAHLGVPVPAQPYPNRNNAGDFRSQFLPK